MSTSPKGWAEISSFGADIMMRDDALNVII
jgi:hypothetical protein